MAPWNIEDHDKTEELPTLKNKLSVQDAEIAALETKLMKQAQQLDETKSSLNDALHKLNHETQRGLELENSLKQRSNDYQNQCIMSHNAESALKTAHNTIKAKDLEVKELQTILDTISRSSEESNTRYSRLEREKSTLEARLRELEAEMRRPPPITPSTNRRAISRPSSSQSADIKISKLEKELEDARSNILQRDTELRKYQEKLSQAQSELARISNESVAREKKMTADMSTLSASLDEKEGELQLLKRQLGDDSREEELIRRIDEDDAKIAALEAMLRDTPDSRALKDQIKKLERRVSEEIRRTQESEERCIDLVTEKEKALDDLATCKAEASLLADALSKCDSHAGRPVEVRGHDALGLDTANAGYNPSSSPSLPDEVAHYIQRMLTTIDRLRGERDSLRRDLHFLETESRFTIEALEAKLTSPVSSTPSGSVHSDRQSNPLVRSIAGEKPRTHFDKAQMRRLGLFASACAVTVDYLNSNISQLNDQQLVVSNNLCEAQARLLDKESALNQQAHLVQRLEAQLEENASSLQVVSNQQNDLHSMMVRKDMQWEEERQRLTKLNQDARSASDELERQISNLSRTLENIESERDSLSLQVANLTSELQTTQKELDNAESRYSTLQFQQLSTLSSNEANRLLRDQLKEMEMRVTRRNEQIGIHQHDIRRLETNLRLQEERISELTAEVETLGAQKDAMVEDCADAREARDAAISRVETLEMDIEMLEGKLEQGDSALDSVVLILIQRVCRTRKAMEAMQQRENALHHNLRVIREGLLKSSEEDKKRICTLQQSLGESECNAQRLGVAFAMSRSEVNGNIRAIQALQEGKIQLEAQIQELLSRVERYEGCSTSTTKELEVLHREAANHVAQIKCLEEEILNLRQGIQQKSNEYQSLEDELHSCEKRLQNSLDELESEKTAAEVATDELKLRHDKEVDALQNQLTECSNTERQLRAQLLTIEAEKESVKVELTRVQNDLQKSLEIVANDDTQTKAVKEEVLHLQEKYMQEISDLRDSLNISKVNEERAQQLLLESEASRRRTLDELADARELYEKEIPILKKQSDITREQLEKALTRLRSEYDQRSNELQESSQEIGRLQQELEMVKKIHAQSIDQIQAVEAKHQEADFALDKLQGQMKLVLTDLERCKGELKSVQEERTSLQQCSTNLKAEEQRSVSLIRFLESKVKESESAIASLNDECRKLKSNLAQSEKMCKAAEVNLSLQSAQHKREMVELQKELDALRSGPDLKAALDELEERNNEMEELLRQKCAEIEENDDKVLEILKDNKKLSSKVESLNRKVQNLQAKLTAAKASLPKEPQEAALSTSRIGGDSATISVTSSRASVSSNIQSKAVPNSSTMLHTELVTRTPSIRAKTPEHRLAHPTVFKTKTPEEASDVQCVEPETTKQIIGKKRRAPDEFDAGESLPPQYFTADSLPDERIENRTPRVRRMLSGGLSGFTPVRRSTTTQSSPKRSLAAPAKVASLIADVTNSPRAASQGSMKSSSKRTWLGKIRGTSSQGMGRGHSEGPEEGR